ncbi:MAG: hypothetical protein IJQ99_09080 [Synergistaceae bacterium]|nr:hypothetical protein [Synergistaceae bacterium]
MAEIAGMIKPDIQDLPQISDRMTIPRSCGGDPSIPLMGKELLTYSPLMRG